MASSFLGRMAATVAVAMLGAVVVVPAAVAQETNNSTVVNPNEGFSSPDGNDNFLENPTSAMELIHQSVLRSDTSREEFRSRQQDRLSNEAASFREQQQRLLQQRSAVEADDSGDSGDQP